MTVFRPRLPRDSNALYTACLRAFIGRGRRIPYSIWINFLSLYREFPGHATNHRAKRTTRLTRTKMLDILGSRRTRAVHLQDTLAEMTSIWMRENNELEILVQFRVRDSTAHTAPAWRKWLVCNDVQKDLT
jgi:hypothetical protein